MKKVGLILLALVLALGVLGVGYAMWSDTLFISGTVTTGTVDISVSEDFSSTEVLKNTLNGNILVYDTPTTVPITSELISYARAAYDPSDPDRDSIVFTFFNLFPVLSSTVDNTDPDVTYSRAGYLNYCADFDVEYTGTIPVHLSGDYRITADEEGKFAALMAAGLVSINWTVYDEDDNIIATGNPDQQTGGSYVQLHEGYTAHVDVCVNIPQEFDFGTGEEENTQAAFSGINATFEAQIWATQWNEAYDFNYPLPPP